jgi:hypothetical protein
MIRGGNDFTLNMSLVESGIARQLRVIDSCDALYGINVFNSGPLQLVQNRTSGYLDAGIYVGGIENTLGDPLVVRDNQSFGNNRGLIVEDSDDEPGEAVEIRVVANRFDDNTIPDPPGEGRPSASSSTAATTSPSLTTSPKATVSTGFTSTLSRPPTGSSTTRSPATRRPSSTRAPATAAPAIGRRARSTPAPDCKRTLRLQGPGARASNSQGRTEAARVLT